MQIGTAPASFKDILSKKEAVEAKLDELDQRYVKQKSKTKHTYVILLPYQQQISQSRCRLESVKKPTHVKLNKETTRKTLKLMTKCHVTIAFLHSQWKKMKLVFPGVSENVYRGSFPYNTRQLLWLGAIWTEFNWIEARIENSRDACMKIRLKKQNKKNTIPPFPTKQRVHKVPLHLWSVGKSTNTQFIKILDTLICFTLHISGVSDSYMCHFHALNLCGIFHSFAEAEWSVGNWRSVSLYPPPKKQKKTSGENIKHAALLLFFLNIFILNEKYLLYFAVFL